MYSPVYACISLWPLAAWTCSRIQVHLGIEHSSVACVRSQEVWSECTGSRWCPEWICPIAKNQCIRSTGMAKPPLFPAPGQAKNWQSLSLVHVKMFVACAKTNNCSFFLPGDFRNLRLLAYKDFLRQLTLPPVLYIINSLRWRVVLWLCYFIRARTG